MDSKQISIFFKNDDVKKDIMDSASPFEKYIILMNETLQEENRNLMIQIKDQESKINEFEEDNENYDNSKRYTKGLLKNFVELDRLRIKIHDIYNTRNTEYKEKLKKMYNYNTIFVYFIIVLLAFIWKIEFLEIYQFYFLTCTLSVNVYIIQMIFYKLKISDECNMKIDFIEKEIKKISDSQDFLNEYIDCI
jgi:hypothetical protein